MLFRHSATLLVLISVLPPTLATAASARGRVALEAIEPVASETGMVLMTATGRAQLLDEDGRRRLPVRANEKLNEIVDAAGQALLAGVRVRESSTELVILRADPGRLTRLPVPGPRYGRVRIRPRLLTSSTGLAGAVWLEGDRFDRLTVYAASWSGSEWSRPVAVAAPTRGSQTGLNGVVLEDGSWLLVWARYDGTDDELVWSISRPGGPGAVDPFSKPQRLHAGNSWPDTTPTLLADSEGGAVVAWSQYDGHNYQVRGAAFDGDSWRQLGWNTAAGSIYPSLKRRDGKTYLLYRNSQPQGWSVRRIGKRFGLRGLAKSLDPTPLRPVLGVADGTGIRFEWPLRTGGPRQSLQRWEVSP